jgi:hypothetical protein
VSTVGRHQNRPHILRAMSEDSSSSEPWRTEKTVEQPEGLENDGEEPQPWRDDENITALSPIEWLDKWQQDKAQWEEERAKWRQDRAQSSSATSPPATLSSAPSSAGPLTPPPAPQGAPPEAVRAKLPEREAGQDAGWLRRLWGRHSGKPSSTTIPQQ